MISSRRVRQGGAGFAASPRGAALGTKLLLRNDDLWALRGITMPRRRRNDQQKKADAEGAKRRREEKKKLAQRAKVSDTAMVSAHV